MSIENIQGWMIKHHKTLAAAESCTGGFFSAQLTAIPGASDYFLGSLVTYSNALKEKFLHVPSTTLKTHGAASQETVLAMWKGVIEVTGADFGVAISGIAGPSGGSSQKPVGTVYFAYGFKHQKPLMGSHHFEGSRTAVIAKATHHILELIGKVICVDDN